jgi:hypothetical protein
MEWLDGWAIAVGDTACRYLSRNDHDTLFQFLCDDGSSPAGWRMFGYALVFVAGSGLLWRLLRRN